MNDPRNNGSTEEVDCHEGRGVGQHVEESNDKEWKTIFEIISVSSEDEILAEEMKEKNLTRQPSNSLNIRIAKLCFLLFVVQKADIFRVWDDLELKKFLSFC